MFNIGDRVVFGNHTGTVRNDFCKVIYMSTPLITIQLDDDDMRYISVFPEHLTLLA